MQKITGTNDKELITDYFENLGKKAFIPTPLKKIYQETVKTLENESDVVKKNEARDKLLIKFEDFFQIKE